MILTLRIEVTIPEPFLKYDAKTLVIHESANISITFSEIFPLEHLIKLERI